MVENSVIFRDTISSFKTNNKINKSKTSKVILAKTDKETSKIDCDLLNEVNI
jgi:hypothetical protein